MKTSKSRDYPSKSPWFFQHIFALVGSCLCVILRASHFQFFNSKNYQESLIFNFAFTKEGGKARSIWGYQHFKIFIKKQSFFKMYFRFSRMLLTFSYFGLPKVFVFQILRFPTFPGTHNFKCHILMSGNVTNLGNVGFPK